MCSRCSCLTPHPLPTVLSLPRLYHSKLHLVDAELDKFRGREKQLLREYRRRYASPARSDNTGGGESDAAGAAVGSEQKSVVQLAHEEETRRVQATIEASLQRINRRMERRRS